MVQEIEERKMPVRIQNEANLAKDRRWNEEDDAALALMLRKKIKEVDLAIKAATTPYERARLKERKKQYKSMYKKVASGHYTGDIVSSEMRAHAMAYGGAAAAGGAIGYGGAMRDSGKIKAVKYRNTYDDMDFDYQAYFRQSRYFGFSLPLILTILSLVFIAIFILGAVLPVSIKETVRTDMDMSLDALYTFKLGPGENDFRVKNDGNWPDAYWKYANVGGVATEQILEQGVPYSKNGVEPEYVYLYTDLGITAINISAFDVVKAWFRTPLLEETRLDFLEDNENFQGASWYYSKFMAGEDLEITKNSDGKYDINQVLKVVAAYGTIYCIIIGFLLGVIILITNIVRMFTYTSRRLHWMNLLAFIFMLLAAVLPVFFCMEGTDLKGAFSEYFVFDNITMRNDTEGIYNLMVNFVAFIPAALMLVSMLLPRLFKNRVKKLPTFVPKGNKQRKNSPYKY